MEKYGVDETVEEKVKLGQSSLDACPECGARLQKHGRILLCPTHGSRPFESNAKQTK